MYKEDTKAQLALKDLIEWLEWMRYAGVQRFYLYDCYWPERPEEALRDQPIIGEYIKKGYVVWNDWSRQVRKKKKKKKEKKRKKERKKEKKKERKKERKKEEKKKNHKKKRE